MFVSSKLNCSIHKTEGNFIKYSYKRIKIKALKIVLVKAFDINKKQDFTVMATVKTSLPIDFGTNGFTCLPEQGSDQSNLIHVISIRASHLSFQLWL